jgi:hypothetical protein
MKVVRLSALRTDRHSAAGRIMSMKNSNDTIGNRTRDLPACSAVPQPTAPPRAPVGYITSLKIPYYDRALKFYLRHNAPG